MRTVGVAELKATLSETLSRVKAGEEVVVTEHGRPVVKIVPLSSATPVGATAGELVRSGLLRPPERALDASFWALPRPRLLPVDQGDLPQEEEAALPGAPRAEGWR